MLKLTKKADYGLIALRHLASTPGQTASARDIAEAYHLPVPLLAKVLQTLARQRIIESAPGTLGGYRMARDPQRVTALEVVRAIDGPVILTHCFTEHGTCDQSSSCTVREPLRRVHEAILEVLNRFTITDLAESPVAAKQQISDLTQLTSATLHPATAPMHPEL